nr:hypothetical protein [Tanacetum cinerariifolium]
MRELKEDTFFGNENDDTHEHLERVLDIISLFNIPGVSHDAVMLRVFPITLTAAKRWVDRLPLGTVDSWDLLKKAFIQRYCPPSKTAKQLKEICNFKQEGDETLYQAWEWYNDLLYKCPTHDINNHQKTMAYHSQKWHDGSSSRNIESSIKSEGIAAIVNKLESLASSESRPPMLNKENYVPWSSCLLRYAKSGPNGKLIQNSILNGPYVRQMIPEPGDANHEVTVTETFYVQTDDELTEKELKHIEDDDQAIQTILLNTQNQVFQKLENANVELEFQVFNYAKENAHLKATYKNLFDSVSVSRVQTETKIASLQNELQFNMCKNAKLRTQLFKKVSDQKDNTQDSSKNTKFAKQPIVEILPKIGETNALSKPVTSNSVSTPQVFKGVNNDKVITLGMFTISPEKVSKEAKKVPNTVIALGMFRMNPSKTSREEKHVPNTVSASTRTKPITVSQPPVITEKNVNSDLNGLSSTGVNNTKTRRPQPRSNTKHDRIPFASKSSRSKNKEAEVEEHHRNLLLSKNNKHISSASKFVGDFKSLSNEVDASLAKHTTLELEIERLLKAVNDWYKKCDECQYDKISYDKAYKDIHQKIERLQAQLGDLKGKSKDTSSVSNTHNPLSQKLENENVELEF